MRKIERFSEKHGARVATVLPQLLLLSIVRQARECQSRTMTDGLSQLDAVNLIKFMSVLIFRGNEEADL